MNGLTWGSTVDEMSNWTNSTAPEGTAPTTDIAYLTDIVGDREVTVRAQTVIGAVTKTRDIVVTFGKGPLSVFSTAPTTTTVPFTTMPDLYAMVAATGNSATMFPASADICGGWVRTDLISITGTLPNLTITFDATAWTINSFGSYVSTQMKLPDFQQLVAVSRNNFFGETPAKGAALAAGWDSTPSTDFWTNALSLYVFGPPGSEYLDGSVEVRGIGGSGVLIGFVSPFLSQFVVCVH
ncbi:MAG: hypothetical protein LBF22_10210 [Deltaproteobacteria bacterium]|nr:hypothetical protein [Deltaproteobacteria bacterium]